MTGIYPSGCYIGAHQYPGFSLLETLQQALPVLHNKKKKLISGFGPSNVSLVHSVNQTTTIHNGTSPLLGALEQKFGDEVPERPGTPNMFQPHQRKFGPFGVVFGWFSATLGEPMQVLIRKVPLHKIDVHLPQLRTPHEVW